MKINSDLTSTQTYFVGITVEKDGNLHFVKNKNSTDIILFENEERINNSILEFFIFSIARRTVADKNEFLIITYDALRDGQILEKIKSNLVVK